jgi:hypothetical protein
MASDELPAIAPQPGTLVTTLSSVEGNMAEIRKHQSFRAFLRALHFNFGPLASFYWGPRYVISVNNMETLQQLHSFEDNLRACIEALTFLTTYFSGNPSLCDITYSGWRKVLLDSATLEIDDTKSNQ